MSRQINGDVQASGAIINNNMNPTLNSLTKQPGMDSNPLLLNLPMTQDRPSFNGNHVHDTQSSPNIIGTGNAIQPVPKINPVNPTYMSISHPIAINGTYQTSTNGVVPVLNNGAIPLSTANGNPMSTNVSLTTTGVVPTATHNGSIPITTNGSISIATSAIPIAMNGYMPISSHGGVPIATNGTIPLQTNGVVPTTFMTSQGIPVTTNGTLPIFSNGMIPITSSRSTETHQPQFYQVNHDHQHHHQHSHRQSELLTQGNRYPMSPGPQIVYAHPNGQFIQPQVYMVPSNQIFPQYSQVIQAGQPEISKNLGFYSSPAQTPMVDTTHNHNETRSATLNTKTEILKPHAEDETKKSEKSIHIPHGTQINPDKGLSSGSGDDSNEAQTEQESLVQNKNGSFGLKPIVNLQQPQGSTSDTSNSNNNGSGSVSSSHSHERHHQAHGTQKDVASHQVNGIYKANSSMSGTSLPNALNNGWVCTNSHGQGGAMYVPVSQPFNSPSAVANEQPQVSCFVTILPPWQNGIQNYGPTYLNNSYIYNNSTTFSNYNNTFPTQPNGGTNPNTIMADFPHYQTNNFPKTLQAPSIFENSGRQTPLPKVLDPSQDSMPTQTKN